jgi:hypothetical protein
MLFNKSITPVTNADTIMNFMLISKNGGQLPNTAQRTAQPSSVMLLSGFPNLILNCLIIIVFLEILLWSADG